MRTFNEMMTPHLSDAEIFNVISHAEEFKNIKASKPAVWVDSIRASWLRARCG
jgi:Sec63 Brl domain